jgi:hypothetical protein
MSPVWTAITGNQTDKAFIKSNLDRIEDFVSEAIKEHHPKDSHLSETHTQTWQTHATVALGKDGTLPIPTPVVSFIFNKPSTKWTAVYQASTAPNGLLHLTPINTSPFARKCKDRQWILPAGGSVSRASGTGAGDEPSRRARSSGRFFTVAPELLARRLEDIDNKGYLGDEED